MVFFEVFLARIDSRKARNFAFFSQGGINACREESKKYPKKGTTILGNQDSFVYAEKVTQLDKNTAGDESGRFG